MGVWQQTLALCFWFPGAPGDSVSFSIAFFFFFSEIVLDLQKCYRDNTVSLYVLFIQLPLTLTFYKALVPWSKLRTASGVTLLTKLPTRLDFTNFSTHVPFLFQDPTQDTTFLLVAVPP